jgi:uncharacterized protein YfiM (DUF2279 family)
MLKPSWLNKLLGLIVFLCAATASQAQFRQQFLTRQYQVDSLTLAPISQAATFRSESLKANLFAADSWIGSDKVKHFSVSFLLVMATKVSTKSGLHFDRTASNTAAVGLATFIGFGKELFDDQKPANFFSLKDLLFDALGILCASVLLQVLPY